MTDEIIRIDEEGGQNAQPEEEGIEIPLDRIAPELLHTMLADYVTREWTDGDCPPEDRIAQVLRQLQDHRAKVVYDFRTESWNIVPCR